MYEEGGEQPMRLFWALYVVWRDGVAERRGVGQVVEGVLEEGGGGGEAKRVKVKSVLLG